MWRNTDFILELSRFASARLVRWATLFCLLFLSFLAAAQSGNPQASASEVETQVESVPVEQDETTESQSSQASEAPRELANPSKPEETFTPSEEIVEDKAVSFPVDI